MADRMIYPEEILANKPLIEAIFEFRWRHRDVGPDQVLRPQSPRPAAEAALVDPNYDLIVGALNVELKKSFAVYERLPTAALPAQFATHIAQHRWWQKSPKGWPAVQLGPGLITVNMTDQYTWESFRAEIVRVVAALFEVHPDPQAVLAELLVLRYVNAMEFDFADRDLGEFLAKELRVGVYLEIGPLVKDLPIRARPAEIDLRVTYPTTNPPGELSLRVVKGKRQEVDAIVWETQITCQQDAWSNHDPGPWLDPAHALIHNWFFRSTEGSLVEGFR